jgi:hypothetical protein
VAGPELSKLARHLEEPAYVAVGFGVLGCQRALVYRRALQRELGGELRRRLEQLKPLADEAARRFPPEAGEVVRAASVVASDLSREARELAKEAVALGRFGFQALRAQVGRAGNRS